MQAEGDGVSDPLSHVISSLGELEKLAIPKARAGRGEAAWLPVAVKDHSGGSFCWLVADPRF